MGSSLLLRMNMAWRVLRGEPFITGPGIMEPRIVPKTPVGEYLEAAVEYAVSNYEWIHVPDESPGLRERYRRQRAAIERFRAADVALTESRVAAANLATARDIVADEKK